MALQLTDAAAFGSGVWEGLASTDRRVEVGDHLVAGQDLGGLYIVFAGRVSEVQDRDGAQGRISVLPSLGDERRDFVECPQIEGTRRERHECNIGDGQRGSQASGITSAGINDDVADLQKKGEDAA
jgi:hypothetical protein